MGEVFTASLGDVFRADPLTPSSSRQARATSGTAEPLRTLPSSCLTVLSALAAEDDEVLHAAGAQFQAEQLLEILVRMSRKCPRRERRSAGGQEVPSASRRAARRPVAGN